ncbi:MAG: glycosyltransferase family 2 protein [Methylomonas sp.]
MTEKISAIIVNYNAGDFLRSCIDSLLKSSSFSAIIIVDNHSMDSSLAAIPEAPQIQVIKNAKNLGFATACNIGLRQVNTEYVLFLNPDCRLGPSAPEILLEHLMSNDRVAMVGGFLGNPDGSEQGGGRRAIPTPWRSFVRAFGLHRFSDRWPRLFFDFNLHQQPLPDNAIEVEALSGACMMVKREAIEDVGLWDEGYFLHCEDLDWCMRFRQKGWKVLFVPGAKIVHEHGVCGRSKPIFVEWHKHKGMLRFYRKFFRHQYPGLLMGLVTVGVWFRFLLVSGYYSMARLRGR